MFADPVFVQIIARMKAMTLKTIICAAYLPFMLYGFMMDATLAYDEFVFVVFEDIRTLRCAGFNAIC